MHSLCGYFKSSVGKKQIMACSGLLLCGFLITHLAGNFLILCSAKAFNTYAHTLITNPLILPAELGLGALFLVHILTAIKLNIENSKARPEKYFLKVKTGRGATFASSTMPITGIIILIFLVYHLIQFRFGPHYAASYDGIKMRDLHLLVLEIFSQPLMIFWYVFSSICVGIHVSHGLPSAFATLGFQHPRYTSCLKIIGILYGLLVGIGFSIIPIWCYFQGGR